MLKSLCEYDQRIQDNWWKDHGWSHEGSDLIHAAHYEHRQEQAFHEAVAELHNKIVEHRDDRKDGQQTVRNISRQMLPTGISIGARRPSCRSKRM